MPALLTTITKGPFYINAKSCMHKKEKLYVSHKMFFNEMNIVIMQKMI